MNHLGDNIAQAVIPLGLNPRDVGAFIGALTAHNDAALFKIPGVTPQMAQAGGHALLDTYASGFKNVWTAASCFVGLAAIRELTPGPFFVLSCSANLCSRRLPQGSS